MFCKSNILSNPYPYPKISQVMIVIERLYALNKAIRLGGSVDRTSSSKQAGACSGVSQRQIMSIQMGLSLLHNGDLSAAGG